MKLLLACCFGGKEEDEEIQLNEMPSRVTAQPAGTQAKNGRTYGKKITKAPPVIFTIPNTPIHIESHDQNGSRDVLGDITCAFQNIQINVPSVESPSKWVVIDADEVSVSPPKEDKGKGKEVARVGDGHSSSSKPSSKSSTKSKGKGREEELDTASSIYHPETPPKSKGKGKEKELDAASSLEHFETPVRRKSGINYNGSRGLLSPNQEDSDLPEWLQPLGRAYRAGPRSTSLVQQDWATVLGDVDTVIKIAEASFAEVYQVTVGDEVSILKVITLKPDRGPGSKRGTAMRVPEVLAEFEIADKMSDIDGFLELKDAYLVCGRPSATIINAHDQYRRKENKRMERMGESMEWSFPHPSSYHKETNFFVMEMVHAGSDLGEFGVHGLVQLFDFFLQLALSLDAGERYFQFEHRDLHENNICIKSIRGDPEKKDEDQIGGQYKLWCSGYQTTILDFTLSRVTRDPDSMDPVFFNLDNDPEIFQGSTAVPQYDVYRDMRTHLLEQHPLPDSDSSAPWHHFIPYTNVLWLQFILNWMTTRYYEDTTQGRAIINAKDDWKKAVYKERIDELEWLREAMDGGRFYCAGDVVEYALGKGWIEEKDRL